MGNKAQDGDIGTEVDSTLVESTLRLSVGDRLRQNDRMATLAMRLRQAFQVKAEDDKQR